MTAGDVYVVRGSLNSRKAAAFDGTDDYILADAHAVARVAANDTTGTYSAWIFLDDIAGTYTILSAGDNNVVEYLSLDSVAGKLRVKVVVATTTKLDVIETTVGLRAKEWIHVAVVQNGTRPTLYINGVASAMTDTTATALSDWYDELTGGDKFAIGILEMNATHTLDFKGMISDVKYWNMALNDKQILDDYNDATADANVTAHLQLHLLEETSGITDLGLGADNGTLTGHAYLCGWGSEWSRQVELNGVVADDHYNLTPDSAGNQTTLILKAA